jgi:hypothetical protein
LKKYMFSRIDAVEVRNALGQDLPMLLGCSPTETPVAMVQTVIATAKHNTSSFRHSHHGTSLPPHNTPATAPPAAVPKAKITATELAAD